jgi:hypothetical protein
VSRQAALAAARLALSRNRLRLALGESAGVAPLLGRLVQRHPLALAALAMVLGGLFVRSRPWRWLREPGLLTALLPQLAAALAGAPLSDWAAVLGALLSQFDAPASAEPAPKAGAQPQAPS